MAVVIRSQWQRGGLSLFGFVSLVCNNMWGILNGQHAFCTHDNACFSRLVSFWVFTAQHMVLKAVVEFLQVV